jgi:glycine/D-amino acid oxidase-like deaminating enzyme
MPADGRWKDAVRPRVAVLGAGMMGSSVAILLARSGYEVVLYDQESVPMRGASRWNEGKVHLGFLYAADPSLRTAGRLLAGGLAFRRAIEQLIGTPLAGVTESDDLFLVHRDSVVGVAEARTYFQTLARRVRDHPWARHYLADVSHARVRELSRRELREVAPAPVVRAGFVVPERSVSTLWVANRVVSALAAERRITPALSRTVQAVTVRQGRVRPRYAVVTSAGIDSGYDFVVNALWAGRLAVDATMGLQPRYRWSHRFRVSLFVETAGESHLI